MKIDEIMRHHKAEENVDADADNNEGSPSRNVDLELEEELTSLEAIEVPKLSRA